jgi:anti-sigma regulatory factor (Ser/Thr protein kinase)
MPDHTLALRLPPRADFCRVARERIVAFARSNGVSEDDIGYLVAAVGEALANAIEHAHSTAPILIDVEAGEDRVVAVVRDAGVGFGHEPSQPAELPACDAERGRGMAIMRRCSDIFSISSPSGKGTVVTIGRYRRQPAACDSVA